MNLNSRTPGKRSGLLAWVFFGVNLLLSTMLMAQSTPGTAGVRGTVLDQSSAAVSGATVKISNKATGAGVQVTTSEGIYSSGPLLPGDYTVRVEAKGFKTAEAGVVARVAVVTGVDFKLQP